MHAPTTPRCLCIGVISLIIILTGLPQVHAQLVGPEFKVNTYTTDDQAFPAVAMNASGDFVVAWESEDQDGDGLGVYGQRFDAMGNKIGTEFQANTYTALDQSFAAVALRDDGAFLVVWQSTGQDGNGRGIFARLYDPDGVPTGPEFQVNTTTYSNQAFPDVAVNPATGGFAVTWSSAFQDGSSDAVIVRVYDADANPTRAEVMANDYTFSFQGYSRVDCDASGNFAVIYTSYMYDGDLYGIGGRRFRADGIPQGPEFLVNTFATSHQDYPDVATAPDGSFVAVWHSAIQDGSGYGIYKKRYTSTGGALTGDVQVNTHTASSQWWPKIEMNDFGSYMVVWQSDSQDGSGRGIYGQRYRHDGTPHTLEFRVNTTTAGNQERPAIASDPQGNLVVVWQSTTLDGSGIEIFGQRLSSGTVPVFFSAVSAEPLDGSVHLQWDIASDVRIAGINVYRNNDGYDDIRIASMLSPDMSEYIDRTVEPGQQYVYTVGVVDAAGRETHSRGVTATVERFDAHLLQNHPNPFNPSTTIGYVLPDPGRVDLRVYDPRGRLVATLVSGPGTAGHHTATWNGRDAAGTPMTTGVYFYRLRTETATLTRKMLLLK